MDCSEVTTLRVREQMKRSALAMALGSGLGAVAEYASDDEDGGAGAGGLAGLASLQAQPQAGRGP